MPPPEVPLCEIVSVCPPTVIVPVRAAPLFAATVKFTVPLAFPLLVVVIHVTELAADQLQPAAVATVAVPAPPLIVKAAVLGVPAVNPYVQLPVPPSCVVLANDQFTMSWFSQPDPVPDVKPTYAVFCPSTDARLIA